MKAAVRFKLVKINILILDTICAAIPLKGVPLGFGLAVQQLTRHIYTVRMNSIGAQRKYAFMHVL